MHGENLKLMYDYLSLTQLRIDFLALSLSEPDPTGKCAADSLAVTGGASSVPLICGEDTSEHGKTSVHVFICREF
jgi:hypothetical protein